MTETGSSRALVGAWATRCLDRRSALRLGLAAITLTGTRMWLDGPSRALSNASPAAAAELDELIGLSIGSESTSLRARFDPSAGQLRSPSLIAFDRVWASETTAAGGLWIAGVQVDGGPPSTIDGHGGLELVGSSPTSLTLRHDESGLLITLEYVADPGNAITHRLTLTNGRGAGVIQIGSAATLALRLLAGDWTEALAADDTAAGWTTLRAELPSSYGNHELRSAERGVYPMVQLLTDQGEGMIVAVSSASAWRVDVGLEGETRVLRAGEYQSDLVLQPGEAARLPDVVTIFFRDGRYGAVASLRRYLEAVSAPPPAGWSSLPPAVFNTWFGFGCMVGDDGSDDARLRRAARRAAAAGIEVFVVDAGWYLGNPAENPTNDFSQGLGTWVEDPAKWLARPGQGGSSHAGLRNFSDYVHSLDVRRPNGTIAGKMRFGLWIEPERFDPHLAHAARVPDSWAMPGAPILDFTRADVVGGITARIQHMITTYGVDYLKVDANLGVGPEPAVGRSGHFWTRWSAGFEQLLTNLRQANSGLFLEHCASGLKRYWIGMPRLVHGSWLDDQVEVDNVGQLLDAADGLLLPRQKVVLIKDFPEQTELRDVIAGYWGGERRNGGVIGFSGRLDRWNTDQQREASQLLQAWKQDVRGSG